MSWWRRRPALGWSSLLPETVRGLLSTVVAIAGAVAAGLWLESVSGSVVDSTEMFIIAMAGYLIAYVLLTLAAFRRSTWSQSTRWARTRRRAHWSTQLVAASEPGAGVAVAVSLMALVVAVFWLPSQHGSGLLTTVGQLVVTGVLVASAWATVAVTFAVAYLLHDVRSGQRMLEFPGEGARCFGDYLYLALAVSSTFGTTDVQVLATPMRRLVASHAVTAFVFNTVILGAVVSLLVSLR